MTLFTAAFPAALSNASPFFTCSSCCLARALFLFFSSSFLSLALCNSVATAGRPTGQNIGSPKNPIKATAKPSHQTNHQNYACTEFATDFIKSTAGLITAS